MLHENVTEPKMWYSKKYKYLEEREKRRNEYESRLKREEASNKAYEKAKREMRG